MALATADVGGDKIAIHLKAQLILTAKINEQLQVFTQCGWIWLPGCVHGGFLVPLIGHSD